MESRLTKLKTYSGITLVELLLYLALFALIITAMVQFFVFVSNKNIDAKYRIEQSRNLIFLYEVLDSYSKKTVSINYNSSTFDSDSGSLVFNTQSSSYRIYKSNQNLYINDGTVDTLLNTRHLSVNSFRLTKVLNEKNEPIAVNIYVSIQYQLGDIEESNFTYVFK